MDGLLGASFEGQGDGLITFAVGLLDICAGWTNQDKEPDGFTSAPIKSFF